MAVDYFNQSLFEAPMNEIKLHTRASIFSFKPCGNARDSVKTIVIGIGMVINLTQRFTGDER